MLLDDMLLVENIWSQNEIKQSNTYDINKEGKGL